MRKVVTGIFAAVVSIGLVSAASAQQVQKIRFGFGSQLDGAGGVGIKKMAEVLKEKSGGKLELEIYPNSQLGGEVEMLTQVRSGNLDSALIGTGVASSIEPSIQVAILPFVWKTRDNFWKVVSGPVGQKMLDNFDSKGIKGLAWATWGERGFLTRGFDVNRLEDLKGKKIRVTQSRMFVKTMEIMGGSPVPIPYPEVYTALQQRVVDGLEASIWSIPEAKFHEVATSLSITNHFIDTATILMNKAKFDSLPEDQRKAVVEAARAGGEAMFKSVSQATDESIKKIEAAGLKIIRPDTAPFVAVTKPVYELFAPDIGATLIEQVRAAQQ